MTPSESLSVIPEAVGRPARELAAGDLVFANRLITLEQVLPNVTHEINNALQVIGGLGEILAARPGIADDVAQKLQRIHGQAIRCSGLLRELLTYARRDEAAPATDVARAIERALNLRRYHLARGRVAVHVDARTEGPLTVRMDSQHVEQVLVNVLLNAEQAITGRPEPTIRIAFERVGGAVVLTVSDSGPGIDLVREDEYFRPFMTTRNGAVGLGLTAVKLLVQAAGGEVRFVEPSIIEMTLPAK